STSSTQHSPAKARMRDRGPQQQLPSALHHLYRNGSIMLQGAKSRPQRAWEGRRRIGLFVLLGIGGFGIVAVVLGILLRHHDIWGLAVVFGAILAFMGFASAGLMLLIVQLYRYRPIAEQKPIVLNPHGIWLRGIGPIAWHEVQPPVYKWVLTKHDVSGKLAVMPLTEAGQARLNQNPSPNTMLVGPTPYLRLQVPYMMLPGIEGFSEADTVQLFQVAYGLFAPRYPHPAGGPR
ncbi:MAG: hypothetical protein ACTHYT_06715, partial [Agrococcus casei]|uniref:hypothetical protein n=1 Tax=Agrococcus casei TaxID=343512 RepID=UPI003F8F7A0A